MKLSTKGRYGLKAMFQLALHYGEGPIPLKNVADEQDISENYLEQLVATLKKNELLESVRGAQGGYLLAKSPDQITVGNILRALEGDMAPADCVLDSDMFKCEKAEYCVTKLVWTRIRDSIDDVVDSITLQDMVDEHNTMMANKKLEV
ncbi:RrF2 family transcriptional regulator [Sporanaerobacter acetigenes]|uniref:Transcriptional regulator, BadM/Rrf2 family n=1 Tax=Sporanaerobacter acetigenes DSM 13106 TaxID=1123281 RepID=A0A1M5UE69_9FIRM|nr:Rrf2 family transcriptional regulator [Sporanaerobacter acetigenes]SHH61126.1 transcriptional regulator, BadM/Rrf2 family [Sporanaerobacter acetigenes DSM 13106]